MSLTDAGGGHPSGVVPGTGLASADGRLLWVDDAFCATLGLSRRQAVGAQVGDLTGLGLAGLHGVAGDRATLHLPDDEHGPAVRLSPLTGPDGQVWALEVEIRGGPPGGPVRRRPAVGYFAAGSDHLVVAVGGPEAAAFGLDATALGRRLCDVLGSPPLHDLVDRALAGEEAVGLAIRQTATMEIHLFAIRAPGDAIRGVVGVAARLSADDRSPDGEPAEEEWELGRWLDIAFGRQARPLLESTAEIVRRTLRASACGIFEYLPNKAGLVLRGAARQAAADPAGGGTVEPAPAPHHPGVLVVPIQAPALTGCLVLSSGNDHAFTPDDQRFAAAAAEMVGMAMGLLAAGESDRRAALHDPLTGLPGRGLIFDQLHRGVERAARRNTGLAVLFVDLVRFKLINDTLGHKAGDEVLAAAADRMRSALRPFDTIGRLGGDEFLVICEDLTTRGDALALAERLVATFGAPFAVGSVQVSLKATRRGRLLAGQRARRRSARRPGRCGHVLGEAAGFGGGHVR
jgi:diguanylate cyclase (GGDEF)-like protein